MEREQAHIGMLVVFGMPGEEQTSAKIVVVWPEGKLSNSQVLAKWTKS